MNFAQAYKKERDSIDQTAHDLIKSGLNRKSINQIRMDSTKEAKLQLAKEYKVNHWCLDCGWSCFQKTIHKCPECSGHNLEHLKI